MIPWICVGLLVLGYPLLWWLGRRRQRAFERALDSATTYSAQQADELREQLASAWTQALAAARAEVVTELAAARAEATAERDKSSRYFLKISDFERERTQWQNLYTSQSIGHGNAQNLMMRTIEDFARLLQNHGVKVVVPKVLSAIREEFQATHEQPSRALAEAVKSAEAQLAAPTTEPALTAETSQVVA